MAYVFTNNVLMIKLIAVPCKWCLRYSVAAGYYERRQIPNVLSTMESLPLHTRHTTGCGHKKKASKDVKMCGTNDILALPA